VIRGCALLDQIVGAGGGADRVASPAPRTPLALFGGNPRGDQRSRPERGLHHDHAERRRRRSAGCAWKVRGRAARGRAASQRSPLQSLRSRQQILMLGRINLVMTPASIATVHHQCWRDARTDRCPAPGQRRSQPASLRSRASRLAKFQPGAGGVAGADDRDHRRIKTSCAPRTPSQSAHHQGVCKRGG